jgi:hypothetical protein
VGGKVVGMTIANLFPWFPLAGKAGDFIVILIGVAVVAFVVLLLLGKRAK